MYIVKFKIRTCCPCSCCGNQNYCIFPVSSYWLSKMQRQNMMQFSDSHQRKQCLIIFKSCIFQELAPETGPRTAVLRQSGIYQWTQPLRGMCKCLPQHMGKNWLTPECPQQCGSLSLEVLSPGPPQCCRSLACSLFSPMFHHVSERAGTGC